MRLPGVTWSCALLLAIAACGDDGAGTSGGGDDGCAEACGEGTSCQPCTDPVFPDRESSTCAPSDPEPGADEFRCGEENCRRRDEVCVDADAELTCGTPTRCRAIDTACDDCACAAAQIEATVCVQICSGDDAGAVHVHITDPEGGGCLNCAVTGADCTDDADCCDLDGVDASCNAEGVCAASGG